MSIVSPETYVNFRNHFTYFSTEHTDIQYHILDYSMESQTPESRDQDSLCVGRWSCRIARDASGCLGTAELDAARGGSTSGRRWINFLSKIVWSANVNVRNAYIKTKFHCVFILMSSTSTKFPGCRLSTPFQRRPPHCHMSLSVTDVNLIFDDRQYHFTRYLKSSRYAYFFDNFLASSNFFSKTCLISLYVSSANFCASSPFS